jgi:phospholipid/cholesterol/gamma-HCH transport system substrate-binding protein
MMMHYITTFQNFKELELLLQDVRLHPTRYVNVSLLERKKNHIKLPDTIVKEKN